MINNHNYILIEFSSTKIHGIWRKTICDVAWIVTTFQS